VIRGGDPLAELIVQDPADLVDAPLLLRELQQGQAAQVALAAYRLTGESLCNPAHIRITNENVVIPVQIFEVVNVVIIGPVPIGWPDRRFGQPLFHSGNAIQDQIELGFKAGPRLISFRIVIGHNVPHLTFDWP
jgi:hypothetical protein